jgi:hypothetical protein
MSWHMPRATCRCARRVPWHSIGPVCVCPMLHLGEGPRRCVIALVHVFATLHVHKHSLHSTQQLLVQVSKRAGPPWRPYEHAHAENAVLLPWLPRTFYRLRWAAWARNPLCWHVARSRVTIGEALVCAVLCCQLVWTSTVWLLDVSDNRHEIQATGAFPRALPQRC